MALLDPPLNETRPAVWSLLDWRAETTPSDPWMIYPSSEVPTERTILTFADCATASQRAAYGLRLQRMHSEDGAVVAVLLDTDAIYYALVLAGIMRAGFVPLPISFSTPPETICDILSLTNCHRVFTQSSVWVYFLTSTVRTICTKRKFLLRIDDVPALDFILPQLNDQNARKTLNVRPYPTVGRAFSPDDVALYLPATTSQRSRHPTPMSHRAVTEWQRKVFRRGRGMHVVWAAMSLPSIDPCAVFMHLLMPLATGAPVVLSTPRSPLRPLLPTSQGTLELARSLSCTGMIAHAAFVEEWVRDEEATQALSNMKLVLYVGAHITRFAQAILVSSGIPFVGLQDDGSIGGGENDCKDGSDDQFDHVHTTAVPEGKSGNPLVHALRQHDVAACAGGLQ